jgi:hypothetical protein
MQRFTTFFVLISLFSLLFAKSDEPQRVYRIVYEIHPDSWYETQAELWQKEIEKNPQNPEAWHNYYNAVRYMNFENPSSEKEEKLNQIISDIQEAIRDTYEYYWLTHRQQHDIYDISWLKKAHEMQPDNPEPYYDFITHYQVTEKADKVNEFYQKLYRSKDISPWLLDYSYNVLMSLEKNAFLITNGDNDTYPAELLQQVHHIRPDVTILNISQSPIETYINFKLAKRSDNISVKALRKNAFREDQFSKAAYISTLVEALSGSFPDRPIYFALTVYEQFYEDLNQDLYLVGMALRYSRERIDNLALIKKNVESFRLDQLYYQWYDEFRPGKRLRARIHMNYLPFMLKLADHYRQSGEADKLDYWKRVAMTVAEAAGDKQAMQKIDAL